MDHAPRRFGRHAQVPATPAVIAGIQAAVLDSPVTVAFDYFGGALALAGKPTDLAPLLRADDGRVLNLLPTGAADAGTRRKIGQGHCGLSILADLLGVFSASFTQRRLNDEPPARLDTPWSAPSCTPAARIPETSPEPTAPHRRPSARGPPEPAAPVSSVSLGSAFRPGPKALSGGGWFRGHRIQPSAVSSVSGPRREPPAGLRRGGRIVMSTGARAAM